jgi:tetratricopeptide (TPR) repeat protein
MNTGARSPRWRIGTVAAALVVTLGTALPARAQAPGKPPAAKAAKSAPQTAPARPTADPVAKKGDALRESGDLAGALALYQKALAAKPRSVPLLWRVGTTQYESERWKDAVATFTRLLQVDPKHGAALAFRGLASFNLADYETAIVDLLQAKALGVSGDPDLGSVARFHAGLTLTRLDQHEMALQTLGEFALEGNDAPRIIEAMGLPTLRMPLLPSELPPERRELVLMAGRASYLMAARLLPAAKAAFEELVLRYPETPNVHYAFGSFLLAEESDRALTMFARELKLQPGHLYSILQLAFEHLKRGEPGEARPWAEQAVRIAPRSFVAHKALGQCQLEAGEIGPAIASLEAARALAADSPSVRFTLAQAYQRAGRESDAARERAEFARLDRLARIQRSGVQAVGGIAGDSAATPPK